MEKVSQRTTTCPMKSLSPFRYNQIILYFSIIKKTTLLITFIAACLIISCKPKAKKAEAEQQQETVISPVK